MHTQKQRTVSWWNSTRNLEENCLNLTFINNTWSIREKFVNQTIQCCFHQKNRFKQEMYTKFLIRTNQAQPRPLYSIPVCTIDSQDSLEFPRLPKYNVIPSRIQIISIEPILSSKTSPKMIINQGKENISNKSYNT